MNRAQRITSLILRPARKRVEMGRRARGDGSVFYDAARGCWVGLIELGRDPETSRRRRRKVTAATREECRDKLDELREEKRKTGTVARRDVTVGQVVDDWLANPPPEVRSQITRRVPPARGAAAARFAAADAAGPADARPGRGRAGRPGPGGLRHPDHQDDAVGAGAGDPPGAARRPGGRATSPSWSRARTARVRESRSMTVAQVEALLSASARSARGCAPTSTPGSCAGCGPASCSACAGRTSTRPRA